MHSIWKDFTIDMEYQTQAKHVHLDVQRVSVRCLGLFGLLENKPSEELIKQLRISYVNGPSPISTVACKALFDIGMWHGPQEVDRALGLNLSSQLEVDAMPSDPVNFSETDGASNIKLVDILYAGFATNNRGRALEKDDNESVQAVLGEGFAKILLLSEKYPSIPASSHPLLLSKLISLYFSNESKDLQRWADLILSLHLSIFYLKQFFFSTLIQQPFQHYFSFIFFTRLKQCLSVFFEHYASLKENHKVFSINFWMICISCQYRHGSNMSRVIDLFADDK